MDHQNARMSPAAAVVGPSSRGERRKKKYLSNCSLAAVITVLLVLVLFGRLLRGVSLSAQISSNGNTVLRAVSSSSTPQQPILQQRSQKAPIDEAALPYKCGVFFFYHVPSTGGATINVWLKQYEKQYNIPYLTWWKVGKKGSSAWSAIPQVQKRFINEMNNFVQNITSNEWKIVQAHHNSLNIDTNEQLLHQWRSKVEEQGCHFVSSVMFRDSLSHSMSLYKHMERFNSTREEWNGHLETKSENGVWVTQLDYFLYNFYARNPVRIPFFFFICLSLRRRTMNEWSSNNMVLTFGFVLHLNILSRMDWIRTPRWHERCSSYVNILILSKSDSTICSKEIFSE